MVGAGALAHRLAPTDKRIGLLERGDSVGGDSDAYYLRNAFRPG
jgi:hypothetical protein